MAKLQPASVGGITFDALIHYGRNYEAEIPDYPVEEGYSVQDTIILRPMTLEITAYLTNTPITFGGASHGRVERIAKALEALYERKQLVTVTTSKGIYRNMGIESLSMPYDAENRQSMEVELKLKQVRVTGSKTTTIPESYGKGGETGSNAGTANTNTGGAAAGGPNVASGSSHAVTEQKAESKKAQSILFGLLGGKSSS